MTALDVFVFLLLIGGAAVGFVRGFETAWVPKGIKGRDGLRLAEFGNLCAPVDQILGR